jgi:hypothetical protein
VVPQFVNILKISLCRIGMAHAGVMEALPNLKHSLGFRILKCQFLIMGFAIGCWILIRCDLISIYFNGHFDGILIKYLTFLTEGASFHESLFNEIIFCLIASNFHLPAPTLLSVSFTFNAFKLLVFTF